MTFYMPGCSLSFVCSAMQHYADLLLYLEDSHCQSRLACALEPKKIGWRSVPFCFLSFSALLVWCIIMT